MGPHLVLIFLERSFFYHYNAFCPRVLKARFHFRTHCINTIIFRNIVFSIINLPTCHHSLPNGQLIILTSIKYFVYLQDPTMSKKIFMGEFTLQQVTYSFEPPDENVVALIDSDLDAWEPTCTTWLCPNIKWPKPTAGPEGPTDRLLVTLFKGWP